MIGCNTERLLVHGFGLIPIFLCFVEFTGKNVEDDLARIVFDGLLVESESLVGCAFLDLHFAEFFESVGCCSCRVRWLCAGRHRRRAVFLAVEEGGAEQIVEIGELLGDLAICALAAAIALSNCFCAK